MAQAFTTDQELTTTDNKAIVITGVTSKENGAKLYSYTLDGVEMPATTSDVIKRRCGLLVGASRTLSSINDESKIPALWEKLAGLVEDRCNGINKILDQYHCTPAAVSVTAEKITVTLECTAADFSTVWKERIAAAAAERERKQQQQQKERIRNGIEDKFAALDADTQRTQLAAMLAKMKGITLEEAAAMLD